MIGFEIASEVHEALLEAAQDTGEGELTVTFLRPGALDESTYPPTKSGPADFTGRAIQSMISDRDKDGSNVQDGDIMLMVSAIIEQAPQNGDSVMVNNRKYSVENVEAEAPGGVALYYMVRARGA